MATAPLAFTPPTEPEGLPCPLGPHRALFQSFEAAGLDGRDRIRAAERQGVDDLTLAWVITRFAPYILVETNAGFTKRGGGQEAASLALEVLNRPSRVLALILNQEQLAALAAATKSSRLRRASLEALQSKATQA